MTISERVVARLREEHGLQLPEDARVRRLYPGHWQRAAGAWSWIVSSESDPRIAQVGSAWPATLLLKCRHEWLVDHEGIDPCNDCSRSLYA